MPFRLDFAPMERVYLPFASDGERVDLIVAGLVYLVTGCAGPASTSAATSGDGTDISAV